MAKAKNQRGSNWTSDELQEFVLNFVDGENCLATSLENLTLKKPSNDEVFLCIKKIFDKKIKAGNFISKNTNL